MVGDSSSSKPFLAHVWAHVNPRGPGRKVDKAQFQHHGGPFSRPAGLQRFLLEPSPPSPPLPPPLPSHPFGEKHIRRGGRLGHALAVSSSPPAEGIPESVPGVGRKKDDGNLEARTSPPPPPDFFAFDLWPPEGQQRRRRRRRGRGGGPAQELPSVRKGGRCQLYQTGEMSVCI